MKVIRNILFYLLSFILCFFIGIQFANLIEAGKGQMLAGGAIVLFYGIIGAFIGLILSVFLSIYYKKKPRIIIQSNKVMTLLILIFIAFFWIKYQIKQSQVDDSIGYFLDVKVDFSKQEFAMIR